jgi:hypothetical protein
VLELVPGDAGHRLAAGVEPVSVAATTRSSRRTRSTCSLPMSSVEKTSAGKPARASTSSRYSAVCGTLLACLSSPTLPASSAGAAKRTACHSGKFHGMIASTGPSGCQRTYARPARTAAASTSSSARNAGPWSA